jgi:hypothetical protein
MKSMMAGEAWAAVQEKGLDPHTMSSPIVSIMPVRTKWSGLKYRAIVLLRLEITA